MLRAFRALSRACSSAISACATLVRARSAANHGIERAGHARHDVEFDALEIGKPRLGDGDGRFGGQRLDPRRLHAREAIEQADAVLRSDDRDIGPRGTDARLALAAAFPRPLVPARRLGLVERRIGAGPREILEIDPDHIARPDVGLQYRGVGGFEPCGVGGDSGIARGDPRKRFVETQILRLDWQRERSQQGAPQSKALRAARAPKRAR